MEGFKALKIRKRIEDIEDRREQIGKKGVKFETFLLFPFFFFCPAALTAASDTAAVAAPEDDEDDDASEADSWATPSTRPATWITIKLLRGLISSRVLEWTCCLIKWNYW